MTDRHFYIATRTRSGDRVHRSFPGFARSMCGTTNAAQVRGKVPAARCCEKCWGPTPASYATRIPLEAIEIV